MICPEPHNIVNGRERLRSGVPKVHSQMQQASKLSKSAEAESPRSQGTRDRETGGLGQKTVCTRTGPRFDIRDHRTRWPNYSQNEQSSLTGP